MGLILLVVLVLLLLGAIPVYPYSRGYGWAPAGGLGAALVVVLVVWLIYHF